MSPSFQGRELSPSHNKNLIINEFSLVIQRVDRSSAGAYVCEATNSAGKGSSDQVPLTIKCKKMTKTPYFYSWPNTTIFDEFWILLHRHPSVRFVIWQRNLRWQKRGCQNNLQRHSQSNPWWIFVSLHISLFYYIVPKIKFIYHRHFLRM